MLWQLRWPKRTELITIKTPQNIMIHEFTSRNIYRICTLLSIMKNERVFLYSTTECFGRAKYKFGFCPNYLIFSILFNMKYLVRLNMAVTGKWRSKVQKRRSKVQSTVKKLMSKIQNQNTEYRKMTSERKEGI